MGERTPMPDGDSTAIGRAEPEETGGTRDQRGHAAIEDVPRDVAWFLLIGGLVTELGVPGVPPVWIFGLMVLWPRLGHGVGHTLQRRAPKLFHRGMGWLHRYIRDLEARYPRA